MIGDRARVEVNEVHIDVLWSNVHRERAAAVIPHVDARLGERFGDCDGLAYERSVLHGLILLVQDAIEIDNGSDADDKLEH